MNEKLTQLLSELEAELSVANANIEEYRQQYPGGVDASGSGNFDDAFEWGVEEGELYENASVLSSVVKRLKEALQ